MTTPAILVADKISKSYNTVTVLHDFSIRIQPGEVHALIGHNGAGKSTVIRMLSGSELPSSGQLYINGDAAQLTSPSAAHRHKIFTVYQELHLIGEMTVAENIFLGHELTKNGFLHRQQMRQVAAKLLQDHHLVKVDPDSKVKNLAHAQKQLIEIVTALHHNAQLILLDEPTTALEQEEITALLETIRRLTRSGVSFLFITHKLDEAFAVADHVTVLRDGRTVLAGGANDISKADVVKSVVGETLQKRARSAKAVLNQVVLQLQDVHADGLTNVNLTLHKGEVLGLYGLVGSGRTEVLEVIFGLRKTIAGSTTLNGGPYRPKTPTHALSAGVRLLTEERKLNGIIPQLDGRINMVIANLGRLQRGGFIRFQDVRRVANDYTKRLSIKGDLTRPIARLSGGNQQKVLLSRWLMREGSVLLLDEPTKGVDIGVKAEIHGIIRDLAADGHSIIVVSSEVEEILQVSDTILVMAEGRTKARVFDAHSTSEQELLVEAMEA